MTDGIRGLWKGGGILDCSGFEPEAVLLYLGGAGSLWAGACSILGENRGGKAAEKGALLPGKRFAGCRADGQQAAGGQAEEGV